MQVECNQDDNKSSSNEIMAEIRTQTYSQQSNKSSNNHLDNKQQQLQPHPYSQLPFIIPSSPLSPIPPVPTTLPTTLL